MSDTPQAATGPTVVTVTLPLPFMRGETEIAQITLRKPTSGQLRGIKLSELLQSDVGSLLTLLPRITEPALAQHEADALDPLNLVELSGEMVAFFMTAAQRSELEAMQTKLMADIAAIFHWSFGDLCALSIEELRMWRELAVTRWNRMHSSKDS